MRCAPHGAKVLGWLLIGTLGIVAVAQAEDVTVTTYYPSPRGNYQTLSTTGNTSLATDGGAVAVGMAGSPATLAVSGATTLNGTVTLPDLVPLCPVGTTKLAVSTTPPIGQLVCVADTSLPPGLPSQTLRHDATAWVADSTIYNTGTSVGIGTTSPMPGTILDVVGNVRLGTSAYDSWFPWDSDNGVYLTGAAHVFRGPGPLYPEHMRINGSGNVGIGMNPGMRLDVLGTVRADDFLCRFGDCLGAPDIGDGLGLTEIDETVFQQRVTGECVAGSSIRKIWQNGTVDCENDDTGGAGGVGTLTAGDGSITLSGLGVVGTTWDPDLGDATITASGGGGGAPVGASYVVMGLDGTLTAERVLTPGNGLVMTDGGANGNATLNVQTSATSGITVTADDIALTDTTKGCTVAGEVIRSFDLSGTGDPTCIAAGGGGGGGWTDDGATVRLTTGGDNVGIGTSGPDAKLQVSGTSHLGNSTGDSWFPWTDGSSYVSGTNVIFRSNGNTERMRITDTGAVRITGLNSCTAVETNASGDLLCGTDDTGGGGGAPTGAEYIVSVADATLTAEDVLTAGAGLTGTNAVGTFTLNVVAGASSGITVNANDIALTDTTKGCTVAGEVIRSFDLSGTGDPTCIAAGGGGGGGWTDDGATVRLTTGGDNVGIGTSGPDAKLQVSGTSHLGNSTGDSWFPYTDGNAYVSGSNLIFRSNGNTERMRIDSGGQVGIGTASPGAKLEINGQIKITGGTPAAGQVLTSDASGLATWEPGGGGGGGWTDDGATVRLTTIGDSVGIGTTGPAAKLDVRGTTQLTNGTGDSWFPYSDGNSYMSGTNLIFRSNGNNEQMRIASNGNVLIGTTVEDPTPRRLKVVGDFAILGNANGSGYGVTGNSNTGKGLYGESVFGIGVYGIAGIANPPFGVGVYGWGGGFDFQARGGGPGIDYGTDSSIRWKRNVHEIDNALDKVLTLRGVYFDWDEDHGGNHDIGMIAEEVGKVVPEVVLYEVDGSYARGMEYGRLTSLLVEAVKEQHRQVEALRTEVKVLQDKLKAAKPE